METIKITIQNISCGGCVNTITKKLTSLDFVSDVKVNIENQEVEVTTTQPDKRLILEEKLTTLGYPPVGNNNNLVTKAKSVVSCAVGRISD